MSVVLKWIEPHELSDYLKKGWTEVALHFRPSGKFLIASPEEPASEKPFTRCPNCKAIILHIGTQEPASEPAKVECPNCGAAVEQPWAHYPGGWRCPTLPAQPEAPGLLEAVQRISDSIGWRSTQGDDPTLYYCEFCSEAHPDWRNVPHHDECPVFVIRAAIAKATTPMSNKPAQPGPVSAAFATEGEDQDESEPLYLPGENASSTLPNRCRQWVQSPGCKPAQPEPVAASEERALPTMQEIHDATTLVLANPLLHKVFNWLAGVTASRAIFAEPASEGGKVEFKNCHHSCGASIRFEDGLQAEYHDCKPVQPEPVAPRACAICGEVGDHYIEWRNGGFICADRLHDREPVAEEMPEAVSTALKSMRFTASNHRISDAETKGLLDNADALESFWRTHAAQPAKVRMTEELAQLVALAHSFARLQDSQYETFGVNAGRPNWDEVAKAVRLQAAEAGVKLPKVDVSGPLIYLVKLIRSAGVSNLTNGVQLGAISWSVKMNDALRWADEALAEIDAAEGRK